MNSPETNIKGSTFISILSEIFKSFCAGISISIGGIFYMGITIKSSSSIFQFLGSTCFSTGLLLVCVLSLSLYTGKISKIYHVSSVKDFFKTSLNLLLILIINLGSACGFGSLLYLICKNSEFVAYAKVISNSKLTFENFNQWIKHFLNAVFCGVCVNLAVKNFSSKSPPCSETSIVKIIKKVVPLIFFVMLFVYNGFEHCIANMFYFSLGKIYKLETLFNIIIVIIGNSLGSFFGEFFNGCFTSR